MYKFDLNDILITPGVTTDPESRSIIDSRYDNGMLPIFTAPMDKVIGERNEDLFNKLGINVIQTRGVKTKLSTGINSYSLDEMIEMCESGLLDNDDGYLIDIANGHMRKLLNAVEQIKSKYPGLFLMVGNVANPKTYEVLSNAGADAIRVNIGSGGNCTTSVNTAIGYPMGSLISEIHDISLTLNDPALIVADGGMKSYSDIIKALLLGADYVMVGGLFNKAIESMGDNYLFGCIPVDQCLAEWLFDYGLPIYKSMRGMSTKEVQKDWGKTILRASEGLVNKNKVQYNLETWVDEFEQYLKSAMSYVGAVNLDEFVGSKQYTLITENSFRRFNK